MKKESILSVSVLFVIIFLIIFLNSCKDNPVVNNNSDYVYDPPRFDWQVTNLPGDWINSIWSPDTNEVFMTSWNNHLLHFKDGQITQMNYGTNIKIARIDGLSKNEGYIVGAEVINGKYKPHIEKWNGSSFTNVPVSYNFNNDFFVSQLLVKSSNEIWISSPKGLIYNFDGSFLTQFRLPDTTISSLDLINGENNRIRNISIRFDSIYYIYEYDGNNWTIIHENTGDLYYGALNQMIYAYDYPNIIYKFENNIITPKVNIPDNTGIGSIAGNSFENIFGFGGVKGKLSFIHWNGQRWSNEIDCSQYLSDAVKSKMVNNNYYCAVNTGINLPTLIIYRAYRKH